MGFLTPVARAAMRLWYAKVNLDRMNTPTPRDRPVYESGVEDARRVLLLGNGPTHGWGVLTHQLALTGHLGRALALGAAEPWDVDYVGDELMSIDATVSWLGPRQLSAYDLLVVVLSMNDAVRLTPLHRWSRSMEALLAHLHAGRATGAGILVVGIPPVESVPGFGGLAGLLGQRHADRLNARTRELLSTMPASGFTELGAPHAEIGRPAGSPVMYAEWANELVRSAASLIAPVRVGHGVPLVSEASPGGSAALLAAARGSGATELKALEDEARTRFRVPLALVTLLDADQQYFPTGTGPVPSSVPRELTYCDVAVTQREPLVVPNARKDPRFAGSAYIDVAYMPFYAGTALRSRSGEVIGSFCIMGPFPRRAESVDLAELKRYADAAQRILWGIDAQAAASTSTEAVPA